MAIDRDLGDVVDANRMVGVRGVEHHRADGMHDGVFLHVESEQLVHAEFEELPDHADGHGEAEGDDRQIQGRKLELHPVGPVEQVDQREADRRGEEAVHRVQHRVPEREDLIERTDLAKNLGREHEHQHDDLKHRRQLDAEPHLDERRRQQQQQRQDAQEHVLIVPVEELEHGHDEHQYAQHGVDRERAFMLADLHAHGLAHGFPACMQRRLARLALLWLTGLVVLQVDVCCRLLPRLFLDHPRLFLALFSRQYIRFTRKSIHLGILSQFCNALQPCFSFTRWIRSSA